jgi:hypothetical protein
MMSSRLHEEWTLGPWIATVAGTIAKSSKTPLAAPCQDSVLAHLTKTVSAPPPRSQPWAATP